jgi:hypothetical protein
LAKQSQKNLTKYLQRIEYAEQKRDAVWRDKWLAWYKRYRNVVDMVVDPRTKKPRLDRSNISIPYQFTMVETVLPRLVETLFAGRPYVTMKGLPPGTSGGDVRSFVEMVKAKIKPWEDAAKNMETLVDYQMNVPMDIQDIFADGLKGMCIYGTAVAYTGWRLREREVIRRERRPVMSGEFDPETGEELPMIVSGEIVTDFQEVSVSVKEYDDPEVRFVDLGLFFVDPNATDIDDARYCGHDVYVSKRELEALEEQGVIRVDWKRLSKDSQVNEARNYRMTSIGLPSVDDQDDNGHDDDLYRLTYYWEDDLRVMILNRCQVVAEGPNPYWHKKKPYDKDVYCGVPGEFYGIGIMEITQDLGDELNAERNQRIDYRSMSMRRMFKKRRGANIDPNQLVWRQGGVIDVEKMDDLETLDAPDGALAGSFNQEAMIKQDIRDAVGAHDIVMGAASGGTATEAMTRDNNASIRFKMIISSVEKRLLLGVARKMVQLNQQFIADIRVLPLFDQDESQWPIITPEDIQGEFHIIASGSNVEPLANKEAFKQRMVELYRIVASDPFYQQFPNKRRNLLQKVFESFDIQDTDDLLPTDDELAGSIQQMAVQQFISTLPPQLQAVLQTVMQQQAASPPSIPSVPPAGGALNTAAMQEQGLQMSGAIGGAV